jgi:hypothetical protein
VLVRADRARPFRTNTGLLGTGADYATDGCAGEIEAMRDAGQCRPFLMQCHHCFIPSLPPLAQCGGQACVRNKWNRRLLDDMIQSRG